MKKARSRVHIQPPLRACSAVFVLGCIVWAPELSLLPELVAKGEQGHVRVTRTDGSSIVVVVPVVANDSLVGATQTDPPQRVAVSVADVKRIEKAKPNFAKTMDGVQTTTAIVMVVILTIPTLFILTHF